jgi:hypothetical protein
MKLIAWIQGVILSLPSQCTPLIFTDLNDGIGKQNDPNLPGSWREVHTDVVEPWAKRNERLMGGAGHRMQQLCETYSLVAHTANKDPRATWFDPNRPGISSMIDYIFGHSSMMILSAGPLYTLGSRLQPIACGHRADHVPIHLRFQLPQHRPPPPSDPPVKWNQDLLMLGLTKGFRREEYITAVEAAISTLTSSDEFKEMLEEPTPDSSFAALNKTITEVGQLFFGKKASAMGPSYAEQKKRRMALLSARGDKMESLGSLRDPVAISEAQAELRQLSKEMQASRKRHWEDMRNMYMQEIYDA